jgi:hypothetical protein
MEAGVKPVSIGCFPAAGMMANGHWASGGFDFVKCDQGQAAASGLQIFVTGLLVQLAAGAKIKDLRIWKIERGVTSKLFGQGW